MPSKHFLASDFVMLEVQTDCLNMLICKLSEILMECPPNFDGSF
jgi:hypothetical protein